MLLSKLGFSMERCVKISFGVKCSTKVDIAKFCGRVHCKKILKIWVVIILILGKAVALYPGDRRQDVPSPVLSIKINKVISRVVSVLILRWIFPNIQLFISVILIDDVLASLDAHVSKHIIRHCILGILNGRTRIIVTESRTLFYYSNQILRVDGGIVSVSDFSLGSFESDVATESASSDEFSLPANFELSEEEKPSIFDVSIVIFSPHLLLL